jgi:SagB-type dehydrogenase family enzyme
MKTYRKYLRNQSLPGENEITTDQEKGLPFLPVQKPYAEGGKLIDLIPSEKFTIGRLPLIDLIRSRESRRKYSSKPISLEELSFLLWSTQGVTKISQNGMYSRRTVPSGGAMHPFETYLLVNNVEGIAKGKYRYLPIEHKLLKEPTTERHKIDRIGDICEGQEFVAEGAVVFVWTVRCYRTEWRYGDDSLKDILISVGHVCQNLYLACESIGAGTCAILSYQQESLDELIGIDGDEEIALYLAPVGKIRENG